MLQILIEQGQTLLAPIHNILTSSFQICLLQVSEYQKDPFLQLLFRVFTSRCMTLCNKTLRPCVASYGGHGADISDCTKYTLKI